MAFLYLLVALIGALVAVFAVQNISPVPIRFLVWHTDAALSLLILLSVLLGIILTSLVGLVPHWKLRSKIRQLENRVAQLSLSERERPEGTRQ